MLIAASSDETKRGLLASLEEEIAVVDSEEPTGLDEEKPGLEFDPAINSYSVANYIVEFEPDADKFAEVSHDPEVLAILCTKSTDCGRALKEDVAKDILVIALTATASELAQGQNILRLAPSNALQAQALHDLLKKDIGSEGSFAVVYEPNLYGLDLYKNFMARYQLERLYALSPPTLVGAFPIHTHLALQDSQKGLNASQVIEALASERLDGIVYMGYPEAFSDLTESSGNREMASHWYSGDGIEPFDLVEKGFDNLKIMALYFVETEASSEATYYYAYDAGKFMTAIVEGDFSQTVNRADFLQKAKNTVLGVDIAKTGAKSFTSADTNASFIVRFLEESEARTTVIKVTPF